MTHAIRVGSQIESRDPFWVQVQEAAYQKAQQLNVDLIPFERDLKHLSREEQVGLVEELHAQELDALIVGNLPRSLARLILDAGIALVFVVENDFRHPRCVSPSGLYFIAQMLGHLLVQRLDGGGEVLIVGGLMGTGEDGRSRIAGMTDVLNTHPRMHFTHLPAPWRYEHACDYICQEMAQLARPPDAIFGLSDSLALAGRDVGRMLGLVSQETLLFGINGDPLALAAIAEGSMTATVETSPVDFGCRVVELVYKAARGETLPAHFSYSPLLVTADNVTEVALRKLIAIADLPNRLVGVNRQKEQQRLTQLETSLEINRRVGSILDQHQLSYEIANLIRTNYGYDNVQLFLWSEKDQRLVLDQSGQQASTNSIQVQRTGQDVSLAESGVLGEALLRNILIFIPDTQRSHRFSPDPHWPETRSRVVLPIHVGERALGLLDLHSNHLMRHTRQELEGLQSLADQLGVAMRNAQLYTEAVIARVEAERANQAKSHLLTKVSQELRAPLKVILGNSQAALRSPNPYGVELSPALLRDLRQIYRSGNHLTRLINDLLDLSCAEIDELELFPETIEADHLLQKVFDDMVESLGAESGGDVEWRVRLAAPLPTLNADPVRLRQILLNLLYNAFKFTTRGHITLGAEALAPYLHIWVEDTGVGIPHELQSRIFEPFVTVEHSRRSHEGIGLGLSITQRLVALHQGSITVESQPGRGSTFHVYLPLASSADSRSRLDRGSGDNGLADSRSGTFATNGAVLFSHKGHYGNPLVQQAMEYVRQHYWRCISRGEIAAAIGVSQSYLTRIVRQELGLTLWEYLTRYRVSCAKELLRNTTQSITAVATQVGFDDPAYFSRVFKKEAGMSPRTYRRQFR